MSVNGSRAMNIEPQNKEPQNFEGRYLPFYVQQSEANPHFDIAAFAFPKARNSLFDIRY